MFWSRMSSAMVGVTTASLVCAVRNRMEQVRQEYSRTTHPSSSFRYLPRSVLRMSGLLHLGHVSEPGRRPT